jgi:hypothetical protein
MMVEVSSERSVVVPCLVDTGALRTRLPGWVADDLDIDLDPTQGEQVGLGSGVVLSCPAPVVIKTTVGTLITTAWFCPGWNSPFGLLGQEGFLDQYRFTLDVAEGWFALESAN